jgi:hypothetical protein
MKIQIMGGKITQNLGFKSPLRKPKVRPTKSGVSDEVVEKRTIFPSELPPLLL